MKVAIYAEDIRPDWGGSYTFIVEVLQALARNRLSCPHELVIYPAGELMDNVDFGDLPVKRVRAWKLARFVRKITEHAHAAADASSPILGITPPRSAWHRRLLNDGIDLLWAAGSYVPTHQNSLCSHHL